MNYQGNSSSVISLGLIDCWSIPISVRFSKSFEWSRYNERGFTSALRVSRDLLRILLLTMNLKVVAHSCTPRDYARVAYLRSIGSFGNHRTARTSSKTSRFPSVFARHLSQRSKAETSRMFLVRTPIPVRRSLARRLDRPGFLGGGKVEEGRSWLDPVRVYTAEHG